MNQEIRIRTIESTEELDQNTLYGLIYLTNHLPESSGLRGGSHTEIQDTLENFFENESRSAALIIAEREPLGRAVGYIATQIDPGSKGMAEVKQLAVVPETDDAKGIGNLLIEQAENWGEQHEARVTIPENIEFTGRVVGKQVLEIVTSKYSIATHPAVYLG